LLTANGRSVVRSVPGRISMQIVLSAELMISRSCLRGDGEREYFSFAVGHVQVVVDVKGTFLEFKMIDRLV